MCPEDPEAQPRTLDDRGDEMGDHKQFLRYLTPGLFFLIQLIGLFLISNYQRTVAVLPSEYGKTWGLAVPVLGLLVSGGIGYALGIAQHFLLWTCPTLYSAGHKRFLVFAEDSGLLQLQVRGEESTGSPIAPRLNGIGAWTIFNVLWRERLEDEAQNKASLVKRTHERMLSLSDISHSAGAAFVASLIALALFLGIYWSVNLGASCWSLWRPALLGTCTVLVTLVNARRVIGSAFRFADSVLCEELGTKPGKLTVGRSQLLLWARAPKATPPAEIH